MDVELTTNWVFAPSSTTMTRFAYDGQHRVLSIEFVSGEIYQYQNVTQEIFDGLCEGSSKGEFFNQRIRDRYDFRHVSRG